MRWTLVMVLAVITAASAQTPVRDAPATAVAVGTGGIRGTVLEAGQRPLRRATVTVNGGSQQTFSTVTDDQGQFSFQGLPAARFTITASKPGYPAMSYGARRPSRAGSGILLAEGQQVTGLRLMLMRGAVLSGTVYDEHGRPMPGIPVMPWEVRTTLSGERTLESPITGGVATTTDDRGMFRMYGLSPGEYTVGTSWAYMGLASTVRVRTDAEIRAAFQAVTQGTRMPNLPAPRAPAPEPPAYNYSQIFHPSTPDPLMAAIVPLDWGQEREGIDLRMQFLPMPTVEGIVVGDDGPARAQLSLARIGKVEALNVTKGWFSMPDGRFTTTIGLGDYQLRALLPAAAGKPAMFAVEDLSIAGPAPVQVTLRLQPTMSLAGRVLFDSATGQVPSNAASARIFLTPTSRAYVPGDAATMGADGTFVMAGVTPGSFRLTATIPAVPPAPVGWTLRSVVSEGRDITDLPFEIGRGETRSFVVTFTDRIAELSGSLTEPSGRPATDYFVIVLPADRQYWLPSSRRIGSARPDVNGRFLFRALPPGDYRIAATTDLVPTDLSDANALTQLTAQSAPVTIGLGEKRVFDIRVGGQ